MSRGTRRWASCLRILSARLDAQLAGVSRSGDGYPSVAASAARLEEGPLLRASLLACARSSRAMASFAKFHCCKPYWARRRPGRWENAALATLLSLRDRTDKARDQLALRRATEAVGLLLHQLAQPQVMEIQNAAERSWANAGCQGEADLVANRAFSLRGGTARAYWSSREDIREPSRGHDFCDGKPR